MEPGAPLAACIGGAKATPPEDCGGIWGYQTLLKIRNLPDHPQYDEVMEQIEWTFGDMEFDPSVFSKEYANRRVQQAVGDTG